MVNGILLVDKPGGPTSHDVVNTVRRVFAQRRVGHAGTLDPGATGLLVVLLGQATRLARWLQAYSKTYEGTIRLGVATDTLDADGRVTVRSECETTQDEISDAAAKLTGEILQTPPAFSALKIKGKPAYAHARQGNELKMKQRAVSVDRFETSLSEQGEFPLVNFTIACSSGTYIRSIAADLGSILGCPAHLESLRRTQVGKFVLDGAVTAQELQTREPKQLPELIMPMREALGFDEVFVDRSNLQLVAVGSEAVAKAGDEAQVQDQGAVVKIVLDETGELLALGETRGSNPEKKRSLKVKPFLVLV